MTAKIQASPEAILDENFSPELLHPADIEQILVAAYDVYEGLPVYSKVRREYRKVYNRLVDSLHEKRGFKQMAYLR